VHNDRKARVQAGGFWIGGRMLDVLLVLVTVAFFGAAWAYVSFCEKLGGAP